MSSKNKINISNPDLHWAPVALLSSDLSAGDVTLNVISTSWFSNISWASTYYYLVIGWYWQESSEIVLASAKWDSSFTTSACKFAHSASDKVILIPYNQIKYYGKEVTWWASTLLWTLNIDCSNQYTIYEYSGSTYVFFAWSYYREDTEEESWLSEEFSLTTFSQFSANKIIEAWVNRALTRIDENPKGILSWGVLMDMLNAWMLEIMNSKNKWEFLNTTTTVNTEASVATVDKPEDCSVIEFVKYEWTKLDYISRMKFNQYSEWISSTGTPSVFTIKNDELLLFPTPSAVGEVSIWYFKYPSTITELTQKVEKPFATALIYYIAATSAWARGNDSRWDKFFGLFSLQVGKLIEDYTGPVQAWDAEQAEQVSMYGAYNN